MKLNLHKILQNPFPVDFTLAGREMIITGAVIIMRVNQFEMSCEFVDETMDVSGQKSVARVQAGAHLGSFNPIQDPEDIAGISE